MTAPENEALDSSGKLKYDSSGNEVHASSLILMKNRSESSDDNPDRLIIVHFI